MAKMNNEATKNEEFTDFTALLQKIWWQPERTKVDYKAPFVFGKGNKKNSYGLVKDIFAMANTEGGGFIVIGRTNEGKAVNCSEEVCSSFDPTEVHKYTKKHGKPSPRFTITPTQSPEGTTAILICIKEFDEHVIICCENADCENNKNVLRSGAIYIRSKTEDATSAQVVSEEDMRCIIKRCVLKESTRFEMMLRELFDDYKNRTSSMEESNELNKSLQLDKDNEKNFLNEEIDPNSFYLQITSFPSRYREIFQNASQLKSLLLNTVEVKNGWSYPCPNFELKDMEIPAYAKHISLSDARPFLEGQHKYSFTLNSSGLLTYREECCTFYDSARTGKPLILYPILVTIYRALAFFGRFYTFLSKNEKVCIAIQINDTFQRTPTKEIKQEFNDFYPYFQAEQINKPHVELNINFQRIELTENFEMCFKRILVQFFDAIDINISDEDLASELAKFWALK